MLSVEQAGHFQFLDKQSSMQRAICAQGRLPDYSVRQISQVCLDYQALASPINLVGLGNTSAQHYQPYACIRQLAPRCKLLSE